MDKKPEARRILVVDDDPTMTAMVVALLRAAGYLTSAAGSPRDAIEAIKIAPPDLAILDILMPSGSGLSLSTALRDEFAIPFVFLSGMYDDETVRRAASSGALAFVVKPPDPRQFALTVFTALERAHDLRRLREVESQLSSALQQGRTVSVAVGLVMERWRLGQAEAFDALRHAARSHRQRLQDFAEQLLESATRVNAVGSGIGPAKGAADP